MKKTLIHTVVLTLSISLHGCASLTGYPERSGNVKDELKQLEKYHDPAIIGKYDQEQDQNEKLSLRNEIVNARIRAIDIHFNAFQQSLYREGVGSAIATDWTVIGLSAAGAVVSSLTKTQTLSAISGGITGAKASFDKNAFFDKTMPAILSQMIALRKSALVRIRQGLATGVSEYPLNEALINVEEYFFAGTMPGAISAIVEEAGAISNEADEEMKIVLGQRTKRFVEKSRQERVDKIVEAIDGLSDQRAFELNTNPPVMLEDSLKKLIDATDGTGQRFSVGNVARKMLKMMATLGPRDDEDLDAWEAALETQ